ncbi:MAG: hypothetical protein F2774_06735 [Actinobacteria bacterium]|uniref:Unannotated protein n=1 Tax=freshwater metagenome TaxID=449393 RepID=A0A6J7C0F2_9ZZZZ|nr:hypothetical protein [Actinomycetota bacterium]
MAKQFRLIRKIGTMSITAGGFATLDLPRAYDYESIFLRINASLQVTVLATSVRTEAPAQLVSRVEVIADGKNTLYSAPFWFSSLGNYQRLLTQSGARATTPPSGVAVATYSTEAIGVIDFMNVDGVRPKDSNFRSRYLSLFQLRLTFGQAADAFVGGTVAFSGTPTVDVFSSELVEETDNKGDFMTSPVALKKVSYVEQAVASSNTALIQRLPAGNLIKSVFIRTEGAVTAGEPSAAVLNNVTLSAGQDVRLNLAGVNLRAKNNADYGQMTAGYYSADLLSKGDHDANMTELWDVTRQAEPVALLDVVGGANNKYQAVITEMIFPG